MFSGQYISQVMMNRPVEQCSYLYRLPVVQYLMTHKVLPLSQPVTFLVGENGTGKSTLLEAIAIAYGFNAEGGSKHFNFSTRASHSELHQYLTLARSRYAKDGFFLRAESFYNAASYLDDLEEEGPIIVRYGGVSLHKQSHGESFLALVQNRFRGNGVYLLDEPEAALSPSRLLVLMKEMDSLVKKDSQFIIATHSPMLLAFPGAQIYQLSEEGVESVCYQQTEHYQLTKCFLDNPERMLRYLLNDE